MLSVNPEHQREPLWKMIVIPWPWYSLTPIGQFSISVIAVLDSWAGSVAV